MKSQKDTAQRILDVAERLVQAQGYNSFSYADVSAKLHITKASLHYHFATKADLGRSLIARYHERFQQALDAIDGSGAAALDKLRAYVELYLSVLRQDRLCLCGMLAADYSTLPKPMQEAVRRFFDANEAWLSTVLAAGRSTGSLRFQGPPHEVARLIVSSLEGAMLVARSYGDVERFRAGAERLLGDLVPTPL